MVGTWSCSRWCVVSGYRARQQWGWHRLDAEWARKIVRSSGIRRGEEVIEIGAGTGALTAALLDAGAEVLAVELHSARADELRRRFADAPVTVIQCDARDFRWPQRPFRVLANPPFGITSSLLRALLEPRNALCRADLLLQKGVVSKYTSPDWASTGFSASRGLVVPRSAFSPRPRVDTAVLILSRRDGAERRRFRPKAP
jgi:23S rRNA (adenine-N6)-dimethyltransferase